MNRDRTLEDTTRGRAFLISLLGGLTLLTLAATVFAVASQARSVSTQAEQSVQIIEDLRVVSIARAELSVASRIHAVAPENTTLLEASLENANEAVVAVRANFDDNTSTQVVEAFEIYRVAADDQATRILDPTTTEDEAVQAELRTGGAFDFMSSVMRAEQIKALEGLRADNDLMNVIGTIATFVVAFVVPSAALYIFESLRRTPRRARALELEYETATSTSQAMAAAVSKEARLLRSTLASFPDTVDSDGLRRSILRFEHIAELNGAVRKVHAVDIDVYELVANTSEQMSTTLKHPITPPTMTSATNDLIVYGDRDQLTLIIIELLQNAVTHGAAPVAVDVICEGQNVLVSVSDKGPGLPDIVEDAIIHDNEYATRGNLLSGIYGFGLLAAREATESLGGRLEYRRHDGRTTMTVNLPTKVADTGSETTKSVDDMRRAA